MTPSELKALPSVSKDILQKRTMYTRTPYGWNIIYHSKIHWKAHSYPEMNFLQLLNKTAIYKSSARPCKVCKAMPIVDMERLALNIMEIPEDM